MTRDLHLLAFGGGEGFAGAAVRLAEQAQKTGIFASVSYRTDNNIYSICPELEAHRPFINANSKGWGYWVWKPYLVRNCLRKIPDGDALVYMDAGCEILPRNKQKLAGIFRHLDEHDQLFWSYQQYPIFNIVFWSKQNLLDRVEKDHGLSELNGVPKVWAGNFGLVKTPENLSLVDEWCRLATADNYRLLDDSPSPTPQKRLFLGHRHDQSILSLLVAVHKMKSFGSAFDFCYGKPHLEQWPILMEKPFLAARNDSYISQVNTVLESLDQNRPADSQMPDKNDSTLRSEPLIGWSQEVAESLTKKHRQVLIDLGLL